MKILMTVDPEIPVPPLQYGGIERIVDGLAHEYTNLGHEVIMLAHPDSSCSGVQRVIGWKGKTASMKKDILSNARQLFQVAKRFNPDVIHSFSRLLYLYPILLCSKYNVVQCYQRAISARSTQLGQFLCQNRLQ